VAAKAPPATPGAPKPPRTKKAAPAKAAADKKASEADIILAMLKRPQGADAVELGNAAGWMKHSVRGFIAGTLKKKQGLDVQSTKEGEGKARRTVYRLAEDAGEAI
jgi:hypothetical protein